ncbi:hypothetical protein CPB84DRAFT_1957355, partial [Gymnopilus junonius]
MGVSQIFVDSTNNGLDGVIPRSVLENAKGFAIFTIVKAGFLVSARAGSGVVIAKLDDGTWSAPSAIGTAGLGFGGQAGAEMTDFLVVLNSRSAIRTFMAAGSLTLGGNMSLALGPLGRNGEASGALNTKEKYSYSKTRGLFGGVSVEGSVIVERQDANFQAYSSPVTARLLLGGTVEPPPWASPLIKTLEACTGIPGHREWIDDDIMTPGGTYAFGGVASPGPTTSPSSFLRKKKKSETPSFPPPSWGREDSAESYFTQGGSRSHARNVTWDGGDYRSATRNFDTKFDSDFEQDRVALPSDRIRKSSLDVPSRLDALEEQDTDPFDSNFSVSGINRTSFSVRPYTRSTTGTSSRNRPKSMKYDDDYDEHSFARGNRGDPFLTSSLVSKDASVPFIKPRIELATPLSPHEGVARGIALYNFNAVESGDLSFRKGDVIVVTKKSDSTNDWWTGKVNGRQGIFPANFV